MALAKGLLSDTETPIIYAQADGELGETAELLGLSRSDQARLPSLAIGEAIWKVGRTSHLVDHHIGAREQAIIDTDARMTGMDAA